MKSFVKEMMRLRKIREEQVQVIWNLMGEIIDSPKGIELDKSNVRSLDDKQDDNRSCSGVFDVVMNKDGEKPLLDC